MFLVCYWQDNIEKPLQLQAFFLGDVEREATQHALSRGGGIS